MKSGFVNNVTAFAIIALVADLGLAQDTETAAANYPSRPVTMVVPFAPGGGADLDGRVFSDALTKSFGQSFVMAHKPGGTMAVGMTYAAHQKPDGYNLVYVSTTYATLPLIVKDGAYDPVKDFEPVSLLTKRYTVLCVASNFPPKTLKEYVTYTKANPAAVFFGTGGAGGGPHVQGLMLESATGAKVTYVHYKSIGAAYPDLMAGRVQVVPVVLGTALPMLKSGKFRAIAISSRERNPAAPDLPTAIEQGVNWEYSSWFGILAPAGTPSSIVNKVQRELSRIIKEPGVRAKFGDDYTLVASTPDEFKRHFDSEVGRLQKLVVETGVTLSGN